MFPGERSGIKIRPPPPAQVVAVPDLGIEVTFADGEEMRTEISAKFRQEVVEAELGAAGLELVSWWTDAAGDFALSLARK